MPRQPFQGKDAFVIIYDPNKKEAVPRLQQWLGRIYEERDPNDIVVCIIGHDDDSTKTATMDDQTKNYQEKKHSQSCKTCIKEEKNCCDRLMIADGTELEDVMRCLCIVLYAVQPEYQPR